VIENLHIVYRREGDAERAIIRELNRVAARLDTDDDD
jgi:hypothetical protein